MFGMMETLEIGAASLTVLASLTDAYVVCLIVGGGLLVISTVFGGDHDTDFDTGGADADFSVDAHVDMDAGGVDVDVSGADVDLSGVDASADFQMAQAGADMIHAHVGAHALSLSLLFSIRFLLYFSAVFCALGTVLSYMTDTSSGMTLGLALGSGLLVGQGVHQAVRALQRSSGNSATTKEDFVGKPARVTIAIKPPARGEVAVQIRNSRRHLAAIAKRPDDEFNVGDRIVITSCAGGTAEVISQQEYEFINES